MTGIWTDPEKDKFLAVLLSKQSLVEKRYFSKIAVWYIYIRLKTKKKIWFNCLRDVNASEYLDSSSWKQMICKGSLHDFMRDLHDFA